MNLRDENNRKPTQGGGGEESPKGRRPDEVRSEGGRPEVTPKGRRPDEVRSEGGRPVGVRSARGSRGWRVVKWVGVGIGVLVGLVVLVLCGVTWWLTPERLTRIVNEKASEALNADVRASNVQFTLWSTFPHLCLEADSLHVRSRNLDSIPANLKRELPAGADFLLSTSHVHGGVNLIDLFRGRIMLRDMEVDSLRVNLVAVTPTINNYDIVPGGGKTKIPYFHIDGLKINAPGRLSYTSLPSQTKATMDLSGLTLVPVKEKEERTLRTESPGTAESAGSARSIGNAGSARNIGSAGSAVNNGNNVNKKGNKDRRGSKERRGSNGDEYLLRLRGEVSAESRGLAVFRRFPFELDGDVKVRFKPFGVSTTDYRVKLGSLGGKMSLDMNLGDDSGVNNFAYSVDGASLQDLLQFLPEGSFPALRRMTADVDVQCTARLLSPYSFSSVNLPSIEVDVDVPRGELAYTLADGRRYSVRNVSLLGRFMFDGKNPAESYVDIPRMLLSGEGVTVSLEGRITDLTDEPSVRAVVSGRGSLAGLAQQVPAIAAYKPQGDLGFRADVRFRLADDDLRSSVLDLEADSRKASFTYGKCRVELEKFSLTTGESYSRNLSLAAVADRIPVDVKMSAKEARVTDGRDSLWLRMASLRGEGKMSRLRDDRGSAVLRDFNIAFTGDTLTVRKKAETLDLRGASLRLQASRMKKPQLSPEFKAPADWGADARTMERVGHTYAFVTPPESAGLREYMRWWKARLDLKVKSGRLHTPGYQAVNSLEGLDITASFDSVLLRGVRLRSGSSAGVVSGEVKNLRQFLTSRTPAPLIVNLGLDVDTVQINQLCRAYTLAHPHSAVAKGNKSEMAGSDDTVAHIIPRNLFAHVRLAAKRTEYENLHLKNLYTDMTLGNGLADIDTLHIGSDFGEATLHLSYDTRNLQNLNIRADIGIRDLNVVNFFANFHELLVMWPEMKNLSGMLSADIRGGLLMFPTMYLNVPSLWAEADVKGWELKLHQNHFIKHLAHMLMIYDPHDLHIADMDIRAAVHGNLLEVFPFTFHMNSYTLVGQGVNNFNGDLFYHVGVHDWPLKLPFGVNIKGHYHKPILRFGGKDWHDREGAKITVGVEDYDRMNVLKEVRKYSGEFVHNAASYTE